ncbi:MAG: hypothetical protein Q7R76_02730 [Candidatus Woesearchaeota archaeon]|nr:hypothetical protein [Candidatus Woesearchaeota archaeon]
MPLESDPRGRKIRNVKKKEDSVLFDGPLGQNVRLLRKIKGTDGNKFLKSIKKKLKL